MSTPAERKLTAVLSADVVGYSRLMAEDDAATVRTLTAYRDEIRLLAQQHRGRVVDAEGDNLLAEFPSATDAVTCAVEIQRVLQARNSAIPVDRRMEFRIGVHLGDVLVEGERIYGDGVNIAARLEGLAEPGGICISAEVHSQVHSRLDLAYEDLGHQEVKNIPNPVRVYRVQLERATAPEAESRSRARLVAFAAVLLLLAIIGWLLWQGSTKRSMDPESATPTTGLEAAADLEDFTVPGFGAAAAIAVLPFDNLSGDPEQEYFADGIAEDLITQLSMGSVTPVIARNSSFVYKGRAVDVKQVGRELGARYIVEGSVRRSGDRVRVSAQLIDTTTGVHVWAGTYDRELRDIFAAQDEISKAIVNAAGQELTQIGMRRAMRKQPQNLGALDHFLRGQWHLSQRGREHGPKARSHFESAIEIDTHFAPAYAGLAMTHNNDIVERWTETPEKSAAETLRIAQACTAVKPTSFSCHMAQAMAHQLVGSYETVITHMEAAIELNPSSALAHSVLGWALASAGRAEEGIPELAKALRLSPRDPQLWLFRFFMGWGHFSAGRYEDAASWMRKSLQYSDQVITHRVLASSYAHLGRMEEARAALRDVLRLQPDLTISAIRLELTFMDPALLERYFDGLRKAGLPEE